MSREYNVVENKINGKSIGYHFANGKVHDTNGVKDKQSTNWRSVCDPAPPGTLGLIEMELDYIEEKIHWKFEGKRFAESVITKYLMSKACVPYISMYNQNDIVKLNVIRKKSKKINSQPNLQGEPQNPQGQQNYQQNPQT